MKIVIGLFTPDKSVAAIRELTEKGFSYDNLSMKSSAAQMPAYLEGEPEEGAATGAAVGAIAGSAVGALGTAAAATFPGLGSIMATGLMATATGGVIGGYLGGMYGARGESQTKLDIHHALEAGDVLIVVKVEEEQSTNTAAAIMEQNQGEHVEVHTIADQEDQ
jgi:hypothetical protein